MIGRVNGARWGRWLIAVGMVFTTLGCGSAESAPDPELGDEFTLGVGGIAVLDMGRVAVVFRDVPADSRCPADVQCAWEGDARVVAEVTANDRQSIHELHTNRRFATEVQTDGYRIVLRSLRPDKVRSGDIPVTDYRANLVVTRD